MLQDLCAEFPRALTTVVGACHLIFSLFDHGEHIGLYGMYHGPWSVFILAKYYSAAAEDQAAGIAVLQVLLILLYSACVCVMDACYPDFFRLLQTS